MVLIVQFVTKQKIPGGGEEARVGEAVHVGGGKSLDRAVLGHPVVSSKCVQRLNRQSERPTTKIA